MREMQQKMSNGVNQNFDWEKNGQYPQAQARERERERERMLLPAGNKSGIQP